MYDFMSVIILQLHSCLVCTPEVTMCDSQRTQGVTTKKNSIYILVCRHTKEAFPSSMGRTLIFGCSLHLTWIRSLHKRFLIWCASSYNYVLCQKCAKKQIDYSNCDRQVSNIFLNQPYYKRNLSSNQDKSIFVKIQGKMH